MKINQHLFFGLLLCLLSIGFASCSSYDNFESDSDNESIKEAPQKRGILDVIAGVTGISSINKDLWTLLDSFSTCEVNCWGKFCQCCQGINLVLMKTSVCMYSYFLPSKPSLEVAVGTGSGPMMGFNIPLMKIPPMCKAIGIWPLSADVCIYPIIEDYKEDGVSVCATAEVTMKDVVLLQVNFSCLNFDGELAVQGQKVNGKTLGSLRVLNPLKLTTLLKKIILNQ